MVGLLEEAGEKETRQGHSTGDKCLPGVENRLPVGFYGAKRSNQPEGVYQELRHGVVKDIIECLEDYIKDGDVHELEDARRMFAEVQEKHEAMTRFLPSKRRRRQQTQTNIN